MRATHYATRIGGDKKVTYIGVHFSNWVRVSFNDNKNLDLTKNDYLGIFGFALDLAPMFRLEIDEGRTVPDAPFKNCQQPDEEAGL